METSEYLKKVYGSLQKGSLSVTIFDKNGNTRTRWFDAEQLDAMSAYAVEVGKTYNTYFGVNPRSKGLGEYSRGTAEDVSAVIGPFMDLKMAFLRRSVFCTKTGTRFWTISDW